jgi:O-antigen ligase
MRVGGTLVTPNAAASYLELLIAPALALLVAPVGRFTKFLTGEALVVVAVALFLTMSRGGWLASGLSVILFCLVAWRRRWISAGPALAVAMALLLITGLEYDTIAKRIVSNDQGAVSARFPLIKLSRDMIVDHPITGVGINNFAFAATQYALRTEFREAWFHTVHNKYLLEWAELGVFGLAAFVWFLLSTLRDGWKAAQRENQLLAPLALGLTVAIAGQMVHMMVDIFAGRPQVQTLWLCAGLIAAIYRVRENEDRSDTEVAG